MLHSYTSGWKGAYNIPDPPVEGAMEFLIKATKEFEVNIFSSRNHQWRGRKAMKEWIYKCLFDFCRGDTYSVRILGCEVGAGYWNNKEEAKDLAEGIFSKIKFPLFKPKAFVGLDDRIITFNGIFPPMEELKNFEPWHKK